MTDYIHAREFLDEGDVVVVECDHQCNVLVMDDANYSNFRHGHQHTYYGGFYRMLPAHIPVPQSGHWNTVIHLGGGRANIRYNIGYLHAA